MRKKINNILCVLEKDFIESIKNRSIYFAILTPIFLSLIFSFVLKPKELAKSNLVVIDRGDSTFSKTLKGMGLASVNLNITELKDLDEAKQFVRKGKAQAILFFPDNFEKDFLQGKEPKIDLWTGESGMQNAQILKTHLNDILYYLRYKQKPPDFFRNRQLLGDNYTPRTAMLPTWILFTIISGYMIVSSSIIEEKERKTLSAILVTPCRLSELLIGKGLLGTLLVVFGCFMILFLNQGLIGNVPLLLTIIILGGAAFSVIGVLAGLILPSQASSSAFSSLFFMALFMPVVMSSVSDKLLLVAKLLPSYYIYNGIIDAMFTKSNAADLTFHLIYLILLTSLMFTISVIVLRKKEDY